MITRNFLLSVFSLYLFTCHLSFAEEKWSEASIKNKAYQVATKYAESIACDVGTEKKNLVALKPWKDFDSIDDRSEAEYILIWTGDIGCNGGSGSLYRFVTTIKIGVGDNFLVDPFLSSPQIQFPLDPYGPFSSDKTRGDFKIIKFSKNVLTVNLLEQPECIDNICNSVDLQLKLKRDSKFNWKAISQTVLARRYD